MKSPYRTKAGCFGVALLAMIAALPVEAANGFLKITSNLDNLEVRINAERHQLRGRVLSAALPAGTYEVAAVGVGLDNLSRRVVIEADKVTTLALNVEATAGFKVKGAEASTVEQRTGALTVVTDLPGARVQLNGHPVDGSVTPLTVEGLTVGPWKVQVDAMGRKAEAMADVLPDKNQVARVFFDPANELAYRAESMKRTETKLRLKQEFDAAAQRIEQLRKKVEELSKLTSSYSSRQGSLTVGGSANYKSHREFDNKQSASFYDADGQALTLVVGATGTASYTKQGRNESEIVDSYFWVQVNGQDVFGVNRRFEWERENSVLPGWSYKDRSPENSDPTIKQQIQAGVFSLGITIYKNSRSMTVEYASSKDVPSLAEGIRRREMEILELTQKRERLHFQLSITSD